jgi:bifunctional non-homologous end joining protein LigD
MLATLHDKAFDSKDWVYEIKYDGYRIIAYVEKGTVKLRSKNNADYTSRFRPVADALHKYKGDIILDGEVVVLNEKGASDFEALMNWRSDVDGELVYYVFDLLYRNGVDYMSKPLTTRKSALKRLLRKSDEVLFCDHVLTYGNAVFRMAIEHGLEGIVAKKADSIYTPGIRSKLWLKIKAYKERTFIIVGYTSQTGSAATLSSLLLAAYKEGSLTYLGEVATGYNTREAKEILAKIIASKKPPVEKVPSFKSGRWGRKAPALVVWCHPELVCLVRYLEITRYELRHASFKGLQYNVNVDDVTI